MSPDGAVQGATAIALLAAAIATIAVGAYGGRFARTTSDFLVASRSVGSRWNAAAISGEYLSAASFLGVAGLIAKYGADALWYPVGFTAGYLGLLMFVAAPLRRSGAYTVPDFAEFRLGSPALRRVAMVVVVGICIFYLVPQFQGAGLALHILLGMPAPAGAAIVGAIVIVNVVGGGMRSITFVQAFQYWLKLTAVAVPALVLGAVFLHDSPAVVAAAADGAAWVAPGGGFGATGNRALYQVLSLILATFLGAMGLPHVLVRFYTNPDGRSARRTALTVIVLLASFYLFPIVLGIIARVYVPQLLISGSADAAVLLLPTAALGGWVGIILAALVAAGAIAAFLSTSSGLLISVAGALSTDVLPGRVRDFRWAAVIGGVIPVGIAVAATSLELSRTVGLVFAVAASTLCPLLVLGIWWRGLTAPGAIAGLIVGGATSSIAGTLAITGLLDSQSDGWAAVIIGYPAAVTVPLAFATTVVVSKLTASHLPSDLPRIFARMHVPERLGMGVERLPD